MLMFDLLIEVDDVDEVFVWVWVVGMFVEYGLVDELWGVWWFYVCDLFGKFVNVFVYC